MLVKKELVVGVVGDIVVVPIVLVVDPCVVVPFVVGEVAGVVDVVVVKPDVVVVL